LGSTFSANLEEFLLSKEIKHCTYKIPAAAGATALKIDIRVTDIPFATPLCSCLCTMFSPEKLDQR
jgi:hypothetical protein